MSNLDRYEQRFQDAQERKPDGIYACVWEKFGESDSKKYPRTETQPAGTRWDWHFKITNTADGKYIGAYLFNFWELEEELALAKLKKICHEVFGLAQDLTLAQRYDHLRRCVGRNVTIELETNKNKYQETYIRAIA